jgi:hypothetical protein
MPGLDYSMVTACIETCPCVLHDRAIDTILEGLVELAKTSNDKVDEVINIRVGLLFVVDRLDVLIRTLFTYSEEVVHCVIHNLKYFLRDEFFLRRDMGTSPSSIEVTQSNINNWLTSALKHIIQPDKYQIKIHQLVYNIIIPPIEYYFNIIVLLTR